MDSLKSKLKNLPQNPGCYLFKNEKNSVIYVGKAKNLKNRVRTYFQKNEQLTAAKLLMIGEIRDLDYVIVDSEKESLLLEANLIKKYRPKYNVILKDDKFFIYLKIDYRGTWPEIVWVRNPNLSEKNVKFFGPYTSSAAARSTLETIKRIFPVCGKLPQNNKRSRTCFRYQIGRCLGPCAGKITPQEYKTLFPKIEQFLKGNLSEIIRDLKLEMNKASSNKLYEKAGNLRDQIQALEITLQKQKIISTKNENADYISLYCEQHIEHDSRDEAMPRLYGKHDLACVNIFKVREGKLIDKQNFILKNIENKTDDEILGEFIDQYYALNMDRPREIVVAQSALVNNSVGNNNYCSLRVALRGQKLQLIRMGEKNAREYLEKQLASWEVKEKNQDQILENLKQILNLPQIPRRIECYDISNIQGNFAVGSMVVMTNGEPDKSQYRKFKIKIDGTPNDTAMMREVLERRFNNVEMRRRENLEQAKEIEQSHDWPLPDLIVIDGGKPQLNMIVNLFQEVGVKNMPVVSLAKRLEEIFVPGEKESIRLSKDSVELKLLQNLRDEAHRFGIGYYRKRHEKATVKSILDEVPGIGPKTRKKLIQKFGSVLGVKQASEQELEKIVGKKMTKTIKENI